MAVSNNIIPDHFIAVPKYHGYFWDPQTEKLYSLKVTGTLTPLAFQKEVNLGFNFYPAGFRVSVGGRKRVLPLTFLRKLTRHEYEVPVNDPLLIELKDEK